MIMYTIRLFIELAQINGISSISLQSVSALPTGILRKHHQVQKNWLTLAKVTKAHCNTGF